MSASAEPTAAADAPNTGPRDHAAQRIKISPRLKYPKGRGIIIRVPAQMSAANTAVRQSCRVEIALVRGRELVKRAPAFKMVWM